jgi:hypothetical protein
MKQAKRIWLLLFGVVALTALLARGAWGDHRPGTCGDTAHLGLDVPCACGDTVVTDTILDAADPVLEGGCFPVGLRVTGGVTLDAHALNPPDPGLCDSRRGFTTGIQILGSEVTIFRGIIRGCGTGIFGALAGSTIERVTAEGGSTGFFLFGNDHTFRNNLCHDNAVQGLVVIGNGNVLERNYCARNGQGDGITVLGTSNTLNTNLAHQNRRHGIFAPGPNFSNGHNHARGNQAPPQCLIDGESDDYC